MEMEKEVKIYDLSEVAEILGVTRRTVYNYVQNEKIKAVKIGGRWKVSHQTLTDFINGK